ncbi:MAG: Transcription initiation factor TFIID subunit 9 [Candelina mexicana]|nr:MAG: Transcription initiation factor TFIID subunit 9 [Candelina mexicana]
MASPNPPPSDLPSSDPQPDTQNTHSTPPPKPNQTPPPTNLPSTSLADNGLTRRPRDARLIHMVLANLGVTAYAERVPLQILDFAYRYTQSTLQDALHLSSEGYGASTNTGTGRGGGGGGGGGGAGADLGNVTLPALRLSVASRLNYQFQPSLPKEFLLELAAERNRVQLPAVGRDWGLRLPHEKYCLTGVGWGLKEEWESEGEEEVEGVGAEGVRKEVGEDGEREGEEGDERMEDIFGEQGDEGGEDREMEDA